MSRTRATMFGKRGVGAALAAAMVMSGCVQYETHVTIGEPHPAAGLRPIVSSEEKAGEVHAHMALSGSTLEVIATKPKLCRQLTATPVVEDETTHRTITKSGNLYQWGYGLGAIAFAGAGVAMVGGPCTTGSNSSNANQNGSNTTQQPCTPDQVKQQKQVGYGLLAVGGALAIPFVVNIFRGMDSTQTLHKTVTDYPAWQACGKYSVEGELARVVFPDGSAMQRRLNGDGQARFDLSDLPLSAALIDHPRAELTVDAERLGSLSLDQLPQYVRWKTQQRERAAAEARRDAAAAQAAMERARAERRQRHAALKRVVSRLDKWARSAIHVRWAHMNNSGTRCFNRVNFEVPCTSAAAFHSEYNVSIIKQATITNAGRLAFVCAQSGDWLGQGKAAVRVPPGRTRVLPAIENSGLGLFASLLGEGGGDDDLVLCGISPSTLSKALGVDVSVVTGRNPSNLLLLVIVGSGNYAFTSSDKSDLRFYQWDGSDVVVKMAGNNGNN